MCEKKDKPSAFSRLMMYLEGCISGGWIPKTESHIFMDDAQKENESLKSHLAEAEESREYLLKASMNLYRKIADSPDVANLDEFDKWEDVLADFTDPMPHTRKGA